MYKDFGGLLIFGFPASSCYTGTTCPILTLTNENTTKPYERQSGMHS
jgi:hypothetical protein